MIRKSPSPLKTILQASLGFQLAPGWLCVARHGGLLACPHACGGTDGSLGCRNKQLVEDVGFNSKDVSCRDSASPAEAVDLEEFYSHVCHQARQKAWWWWCLDTPAGMRALTGISTVILLSKNPFGTETQFLTEETGSFPLFLVTPKQFVSNQGEIGWFWSFVTYLPGVVCGRV